MTSSRNARVWAFSRIGPIGLRMVVVVPDRPTMNTYFCQISRWISGDAAFQAGVEKTLPATGDRAVQFPEQQTLHGSGLTDHGRPIDGGGYITDPAHDAGRVERVAKIPIFEHAVLERDHRRVWPDDRFYLLDRCRSIPQLHGNEHKIGRSNRRRIARRLHLRKVKRGRPLDGQALRPHGVEMGAARHEMDISAACGKPGAEIAA